MAGEFLSAIWQLFERHALEVFEIFEGLSVQRHNHRNLGVCSRGFWSGTILSTVQKPPLPS